MSIISTKYLLQDAQANGYAVPAFNIHNAETIQAILEVCSEMRSPVILAGTPGTFKHIALEEIYALCSAYSTTYNMPLALHLDHHESLDDIRRKVHAGVRSDDRRQSFPVCREREAGEIGCRLLPLPGLQRGSRTGPPRRC